MSSPKRKSPTSANRQGHKSNGKPTLGRASRRDKEKPLPRREVRRRFAEMKRLILGLEVAS